MDVRNDMLTYEKNDVEILALIPKGINRNNPRPYMEKEKEERNAFFKYITSCKLDITGLWQKYILKNCMQVYHIKEVA